MRLFTEAVKIGLQMVDAARYALCLYFSGRSRLLEFMFDFITPILEPDDFSLQRLPPRFQLRRHAIPFRVGIKHRP